MLRSTPRAFGICVPANWGFARLVRKRLEEDPSLVHFMDGRTSALHEGARGGDAEVVGILLAAGADPLLRDGDGRTALEVAAERGHAEVVEMLSRAARET